MKRIFALFALCSIGMALQAEGKQCKATGQYFSSNEECAKQCPSGCEAPLIDIKIQSGIPPCLGPACPPQAVN